MKLEWNTFKDENVHRSKIYGKRKPEIQISKHIDRLGAFMNDVNAQAHSKSFCQSFKSNI